MSAGPRGFALAAAAGVLGALAFPAPGAWPLAFVAWAPLLLALGGVSARRGALLGLAAGVPFFLILLRWLAGLSMGAWLALSVVLALHLALFGAAGAVLLARPGWTRLAVPAAWVAIEWMRGWLVLGGFGWGALGYALAPAPRLIQLAAVGGVSLLSLAAMASNLALATAWPALRARDLRAASRPLALAAAVPLLLLVTGSVALSAAPATSPTLRVAVVQAAIDPRAKWGREGLNVSITSYVALTDRAAAESPALIVWPETAFPALLDEGAQLPVHSTGLRRRVDDIWHAALLFGVPEAAAPERFWNAAVLYAPGGVRAPSYHKRRLVPFAEYRPFADAPIVTSGPEFSPGEGGGPFEVAGARVGVLICFEDVFGDEAVARAADAELLVVITNDGWFGPDGLAQHLDIAVLRAVETRRAVARAANTGISALIDPYGRVRARVPGGPGFVVGELPLSRETTLFAHFPDAVPLAAFAVMLAALADVLVIRRRPRPA